MINNVYQNDKIKLPNKDVLFQRRPHCYVGAPAFGKKLMVLAAPPPALAEEQLPKRIQVVFGVFPAQTQEG